MLLPHSACLSFPITLLPSKDSSPLCIGGTLLTRLFVFHETVGWSIVVEHSAIKSYLTYFYSVYSWWIISFQKESNWQSSYLDD